MKNFRIKKEEGFTLVELMIVVAIIGILAAVAIPQFAAYRIRGFNSSSQSDLRNLSTTQAAFFSDWLIFGASAAATGAGGGAGALLTGPGGATTLITGADAGGINRDMQIGLGNAVSVVSNTNAAAAGPPAVAANSTFASISKHIQGDTYYGADGDTTAMYQAQVDGFNGTILATGDCPASTAVDDYALLAGGAGPGGSTWSIK